MPATDFARIAWNPSYRAPRAADLKAEVAPTIPEVTTSATERRLLDAVLADPDADEPRLRYAEWCDRQGDERGEFIRVQFRLFTAENAEDAETERELLAEHGDRWLAPFAPWSVRDVVFRRGFPEAMSLAGRAFISLGEALTRSAPVRDVRLVAIQPYMAELARCPHLAKLCRLDLTGNWIGPEGVRELAGSSYLTGLRELDLSGNGLDADAVAPLLAAALPNAARTVRFGTTTG